jgi:Flp pilus assembly protein TadD
MTIKAIMIAVVLALALGVSGCGQSAKDKACAYGMHEAAAHPVECLRLTRREEAHEAAAKAAAARKTEAQDAKEQQEGGA